MRASLRYGIVVALLLMLAGVARAELVFTATITHDQEVASPPVPDQGSSGTGTFILNDAMTALSYDITLFGLDIDGLQTPGNGNDNATRFHIHAAPAGFNGGIVFGMKDPNHDLDDLVIDAAAGRITGVWDGIEGSSGSLAAQLGNLLANGLYFNVHTPDFPSGEIRGQIILQAPAPASLALVAIALAGLGLRRRNPTGMKSRTVASI